MVYTHRIHRNFRRNYFNRHSVTDVALLPLKPNNILPIAPTLFRPLDAYNRILSRYLKSLSFTTRRYNKCTVKAKSAIMWCITRRWHALNLTNSYNDDNAAEYKCFYQVISVPWKDTSSSRRVPSISQTKGPPFVTIVLRGERQGSRKPRRNGFYSTSSPALLVSLHTAKIHDIDVYFILNKNLHTIKQLLPLPWPSHLRHFSTLRK